MGYQDRLSSLLTRRAFGGLVGKGAAAVAFSGLVAFLDLRRELIRPPGALPEEDFLSLCIRCDCCAKACPDGFITPVPLSESVVNAGTPRLFSYCLRCWRCTYSCPTGALRFDR